MKTLATVLVLAGALPAECSERCDAKAIPVRGRYVFDPPENSVSAESRPFRELSMEVEEKTVTAEYELPDGTRWKATYRIAARGKTGR